MTKPKQSYKKQIFNTKWRKTSTVLRGMAATSEGSGFLLLHSKETGNIKKQTKEPFPFGEYLKELRERKGVSLKIVENDTGVSNAYLSQLETGKRRKLPNPERLRILADYFNVSIQQLLEKAGYFGRSEIGETHEQKTEKAFLHVTNDPVFKYGSRLKNKLDLDTKRFIIEMYESTTNKKILNMDDPAIHQTPKPYDTEFLVVAVIDARPTEIMFAGAFEEAKSLSEEMLRDYRSKNNLHVSIWEWSEDRYLKRKE